MINDKTILAIETSDVICGAAIYFSDKSYYSNKIYLKNSHSDKLFSLIDQLVFSANININQIRAIAVSEGPGSFTGLRIGYSAAKGLASGLKIPIIPVPTFEALALQIASVLPNETNFIIANRVNKEEVYSAKFQVKFNNYIFTHALEILKKEDFAIYSKDILTFGNAVKLLDQNSNSVISSPSPEFVAMWAEKFGEDIKTTEYDFLEPNYLKNFTVRK